jgi:hypothetical protein
MIDVDSTGSLHRIVGDAAGSTLTASTIRSTSIPAVRRRDEHYEAATGADAVRDRRSHFNGTTWRRIVAAKV